MLDPRVSSSATVVRRKGSVRNMDAGIDLQDNAILPTAKVLLILVTPFRMVRKITLDNRVISQDGPYQPRHQHRCDHEQEERDRVGYGKTGHHHVQ